MRLHKKLGRWVFDQIPSYNQTLNYICQRYVDRYNGDNNSDPSRNGEEIFLRTELPKLRGGVIFDVGANIGNWTKTVLQISPSIQFHCFEPSLPTFRQLASNNFPSNVTINNMGLGDSEGQAELNIVDPASGLNSLHMRRGVASFQPVTRETISLTTADDYCKQHNIDQIDLLKADVEGHELSVFKGMTRMLRKGRVKIIQFEYGFCSLDARVCLADIWDFLAPFGFKFFKLFPQGPREIPVYSQALETFKYANYLARKP